MGGREPPPLVVPDTRTDERFRWVKGLDQERFISMLSVPVVAATGWSGW